MAAKKKKDLLSLVKKFDNRDEADVTMQTEGTWSLHYCHETDGKKKYYTCNRLKRRDRNVPQKCTNYSKVLRIRTVCSGLTVITIMRKKLSIHRHKIWVTLFLGSFLIGTIYLFQLINKLFQLKMKPKAIMQNLSKITHFKPLKMSQLRHYLSDRRR